MIRTIRVVLAIAVLTGSVLMASPFAAQAGFPGTNGKIAFCQNENGRCSIYLMDPDVSNVTFLRATGSANARPRWSADGKRIVYAGAKHGGPGFFIIRADGAVVRKIATDGENPSFSPGGGTILFDDEVNVWTMRTDGTDLRQLTNFDPVEAAVPDPVFSPDGRWIAYLHGTVDLRETHLWLMRPDGTHQHRIAPKGLAQTPDWAPDSGAIVFANFMGADHLFTVTVPGRAVTRITDGLFESEPAWSPDGSLIVYRQEVPDRGPHIWLVKPDGTDAHEIQAGPDSSFPNGQPIPP
jgi:Tol biopolymer transport system component